MFGALLTVLLASHPPETAQHAYDELRARMDRATTATVTTIREDGNAWTHERTYRLARPHKLRANGYGLNFRTDGVRTFEADSWGAFNRRYSPLDMGVPVGFESFSDPPPRVFGIGLLNEQTVGGHKRLALQLWFRGQNLMLYLDPETRLPCASKYISANGSEDIETGYSDVALNDVQPPSFYRISYPTDARKVIYRMQEALSSRPKILCEFSKTSHPIDMDLHRQRQQLADLLSQWPWPQIVRGVGRHGIKPIAEPVVYNGQDAYRISRGFRRGKADASIYISAENWLPLGFSAVEGTTGKYVRFYYREFNGSPIR